jgi:peptide/nickel transport system ATP-binding protein
MANRVAVMYGDKIVEHGSTRDIIDNPQDSYTNELIAAVPVPG